MPTYIFNPGLNTGGSQTLAGPLLLGNGSASNPSYSFSNFTSTGITVGSGPILYLQVNAATAMSLSSSSAFLNGQGMTAGTMTNSVAGDLVRVVHRFDWTNAMVVALGAVLSGNIAICSTPGTGKTVITNAYVVITTPSAGTTTMTVSVGRTGAAYIDYITAQNAQAAANTVYGGAAGHRGANLTGYDLPSWTSATTIYAQFVSTVQNLSAQTAGAGSIYIETMILP